MTIGEEISREGLSEGADAGLVRYLSHSHLGEGASWRLSRPSVSRV